MHSELAPHPTDVTVRRPLQWVWAAATNTGCVRALNEDAVVARPDIGLWAVADGMGGHDAGNVASGMIAEALSQLARPQRLSDFITAVEESIGDVNRRLLEYSEIMLEGRVVGSTFVGLLVCGEVGMCLWMGDSRLYRYRRNELVQLSRDHSEVAELVRSGVITPEEARHHPDANVITRAVGTSDELFVDLELFDAKVGDTLLLCSDGLYNCVTPDEIASCLSAGAEDAANRLIDTALANGAPDNVSVVVIKAMRRSA